ncbi:MAG: flavodoxin family protein [Acetatifactor sp.]
MNKKVVVISTSIRANSNSEVLAKSFADGASYAGNEVEFITLKDKQIDFCKGCLVCQQTGNCVIKDDVTKIMDKVIDADIVVWATPIYYYEMSGQMKVLIDRLNPMFSKDYKFRDVYFLATAAEDEEHVYEKALSGLNGWIDCFDKAELKGYVFCGGVTMGGEISGNTKLKETYDMGAGV